MQQPSARRLKAVYAFMGPNVELERTLPLDDGERVIGEGRASVRTGWFARGVGFLRVSDRRICVVEHRALTADRIVEVPPGALLGITERRNWVHLELALANGTAVISVRAFGPFARREDWPSSPLKQATRSWTAAAPPTTDISRVLSTWLEHHPPMPASAALPIA